MENSKKNVSQLVLRIILIAFLALFILFNLLGAYTFKNAETYESFKVSTFNLSLLSETGSFNIFGLLITLSVVAAIVFFFFKKPILVNIGVLLVFFAFFAFFIKPEYFLLTNYSELYGDVTYQLDVFGVLSIVFASLSLLVAFSYTLDIDKLQIRDMVEIAILVGLAILLDMPFLKIKLGANGGSISFEMIPLVILALRLGPVKGFLASGVIYGFLSCLLGGYGLAYFPFDYLLAFGVLSLVGFFRNFIFPKDGPTKYRLIPMLILGSSLFMAIILKIFAHTISGVIFWETPFGASFVYNVVPQSISGAITLVAILLLYPAILRVNRRFS